MLISSILEAEISRIGGDLTDDYASNALLKEFDVHYVTDGGGSALQDSKG